MIVVSYEKELRKAFAAGKAAAAAQHLAKRPGGEIFAKTPQTYEEWIESIKHRPAVVRG
jgi:uncharacterized protein (DUF849 family)